MRSPTEKLLRKLLKQAPAIIAAILFMTASAYAAKKPKRHDKTKQKTPAVSVQQEKHQVDSAEKLVEEPKGQGASQEQKKALAPSKSDNQKGGVGQASPSSPTAPGEVSAPKTTPPPSATAPAHTVEQRRPAPETTVGAGWTTRPPPDFTPKGRWHRSNLERHWEKHQAEFPEFNSEEEYAIAALYFFEHPPKGTLTKTSSNGERMFYHQDSNTFGVVTSDGTPKTMFRPSAGINYWRRQ